MKLLVNIRGCNGAGKSTVPMLMLENDPKAYVVGIGQTKIPNAPYLKPAAPYLTVFPSYGWVALGTYYNKTGGLDTYKNNEMTFEAFKYAWTKFPEYDVLMEGVIASTVKSTYAELFQEYEYLMGKKEIPKRKIIVMSFLPPLEVCLARVQERNGGKPVKTEQIAGKWRTVDRNVQYFKDMGFTSLRVNTAKCPRERMLINFLKTCEKYREA